MMRTHLFVLIFICLFAFALTTGCGRVALYQELAEEDANEILVLLSENGIKAGKKRLIQQNEVSYAIEVKEADMTRARSLLLRHNLPRRRELGLTGVYKEKGLIPTPDEQKARFLLALKGEIINSLERMPDIVDADVVLNVPTRDEFASADAQHRQRPTASVVVRVKPSSIGTEAVTEAKVQQFVANAVEGLNPRDVTVVISYIPVEEKVLRPGDVMSLPQASATGGRSGPHPPAGLPPLAVQHKLIGLTLDAESKERLKVYLLVFFLLLLILSAALIIAIVQTSRMRRTLAAFRGSAGTYPAVEGHVLEEGPPELPGGGSPAR